MATITPMIYPFRIATMSKSTNAIVRGHSTKDDTITYHMQDRRRNLPKFERVEIDGIRVNLVLKDGSVMPLPNCFVGYVLKTAFPHEITLVKP